MKWRKKSEPSARGGHDSIFDGKEKKENHKDMMDKKCDLSMYIPSATRISERLFETQIEKSIKMCDDF